MNQCPLCQAELVSAPGSQIHPGDENYGITVWCPNAQCPAQEVSGHGSSIRQAVDVIYEKYKLPRDGFRYKAASSDANSPASASESEGLGQG